MKHTVELRAAHKIYCVYPRISQEFLDTFCNLFFKLDLCTGHIPWLNYFCLITYLGIPTTLKHPLHGA